jgi:hypothetical protein
MADSRSVPRDHMWRVRPAGRGGAVFVVALWVGVATLVTTGYSLGVAVVVWVPLVVIVPAAWRMAFVPYVAVTSSHVVVQGILIRRTIEYNNIREVRGGYYGLTFVLKDGGFLTAWAVQKSNIARWTGSRARADEVSDEIMAHVASDIATKTRIAP